MSLGAVLRRLSAILAGDVVGYSRLMETDEVGTLAALKTLRKETLEPLVAQYQGRIFKIAGDAVLIEFASPVNAVQCAIDLQSRLAVGNKDVPGDRQISLRIGINLGDVMVEGSDLYGDGVNIAARLESMAEPGGILVSESVYGHVTNKVGARFDDLGLQNLKNIIQPICVYRAKLGSQSTPAPATAGSAKEPARSEKVSIAVLPFDNMSGDPEQGYFSDGITEDVITELSKFRELLVIARNSSFQFRGKANDVGEVARKLGVQYVVEGSVRKAGNRVRVTVQLIDASSAAHVWSERYDRELDDIFAIQDEITQMIASRLVRHTRSSVVARTRNRPTDNMSAYDLYLRALQLNGGYDTMLQAEPLLRRAVELDSGFAAAHALLSVTEAAKCFWSSDRGDLERGLERAKIAMDLDAEEATGYHAHSFSLLYLRRFREADASLSRAISLNPNNPLFQGFRAEIMLRSGRQDEALRELGEAQRRDPFAADWLWDVAGMILTVAGRYREAIASYGEMAHPPRWAFVYLAVCHVELGEMAAARGAMKRIKEAFPGMSIDQVVAWEDWFEDPSVCERFRAILKRAEAEG